MEGATNVDNTQCCGITKNQFIIVMCVTLGVGLILLIVGLCCYFKRRKSSNNGNEFYKNNTKNNQFDSVGNIKQEI